MKTISQYKEDIAALMKKASDIDSQCELENREPTSAELTIKNEILDTVQEYREIVNTMERQERMRAAIEKPHDPVTLENKKPKGSGVQVVDKEKFNSFGEQLAAVMRAGMPGGSVDKRLNIQNAATGLNETVSSDGGFLVQQDYSAALLQDVINTGVLAQRCRRIPISANSNGIKIPGVDETSRASTRSGGVVAYWKDEAALKTASRPKFRMIELSLKKLIGLCYATDELLQDASALEAFVKMAFVDEFGFQIDDAIINGTGAGMPLGVLNAGSLVTVSKETGQAAATLVTENIVKMYSRRFASKTNNYIWFYNQSIEPQLMTMSVSVGTGGGPVYMPPGGLNSAPYGMLLGRPAIAIEQAAALGTIGDIMFCDFTDGYLLAEKGGIQTDMSIHVQFLYDESVFRFVLRIDGQPVRASALTPYKGGSGATQSHFIALETRS
jgi:HK97 family phage major capsid protein